MAIITAKKLLCQYSICRAEATQRTTTIGTSTTINHRNTHSPPLYTFHGRKGFCCWSWPLMAMITAKKLLCQWKFAEPVPQQKKTTMATNTTINCRTTHSPPLYICHCRHCRIHISKIMNSCSWSLRIELDDIRRPRWTMQHTATTHCRNHTCHRYQRVVDCPHPATDRHLSTNNKKAARLQTKQKETQPPSSSSSLLSWFPRATSTSLLVNL
jgi:hypothetical protein